MASLMPNGKQQYTNSSGIPLIGGKVFTYAAGTTTPKATYTDQSASVANTNPVLLNIRGEAAIWWSGNYKVVVKDAFDNLIYTTDNYKSIDQVAKEILESVNSSLAVVNIIANTMDQLRVITDFSRPVLLLGYYAAGDKSARVYNYIKDSLEADNGGSVIKPSSVIGTGRWIIERGFSIFPEDFGAKGNGVDNDTEPFKNAVAACTTNKQKLQVRSGKYLLNEKIVVPYGLEGSGSSETIFKGVNLGVKSGNLIELNGPGLYRGFSVDGSVSADPTTWNASNYNSFTGWSNIYLTANDIECVDIESRNSAQAGFGAWQRERCTFENCRTNITRGNFGDGFFANLCKDFKYTNCKAFDYTRIGFVFDGDGITLISERASYQNCYAEFGHDSSILYGGGEYNSGFWAENHDNAQYSNCTAYNNSSSSFTAITANGSVRNGTFNNCRAKKSPTGYKLEAYSATDKFSVVFDACTYDADGVVPLEIYSIGKNTFSTLLNCSAKLDGGGDQTRVIGFAHGSRVHAEDFNEYWTNKPLSNLYDTSKASASIGGFPGASTVPDSIFIENYKVLDSTKPCVVKWIGVGIGGALSLTRGNFDIPRFVVDGGVVLEQAVINSYGIESIFSGNYKSFIAIGSYINNKINIGWSDNLNQALFDECYFSRSVAVPNVFFYRTTGVAYKPSRLKFVNSTFNSDLALFNYYIQQNADPSVFNYAGQDIVVNGCEFSNTGAITSNFPIRQESPALASSVYASGCWKSASVANFATNLKSGSVINSL